MGSRAAAAAAPPPPGSPCPRGSGPGAGDPPAGPGKPSPPAWARPEGDIPGGRPSDPARRPFRPAEDHGSRSPPEEGRHRPVPVAASGRSAQAQGPRSPAVIPGGAPLPGRSPAAYPQRCNPRRRRCSAAAWTWRAGPGSPLLAGRPPPRQSRSSLAAHAHAVGAPRCASGAIRQDASVRPAGRCRRHADAGRREAGAAISRTGKTAACQKGSEKDHRKEEWEKLPAIESLTLPKTGKRYVLFSPQKRPLPGLFGTRF